MNEATEPPVASPTEFRVIDSPVGPLTIAGHHNKVVHLRMVDQSHPPKDHGSWRPASDPAAFQDVVDQLDAYFSGVLTEFEVALDPVGTSFQRTVWAALREIPYGQTWSYGQLAERIGRPGASRAVGMANGRNPVGIIVPCHRIVGADGSLTGYAGGIERKRYLLEHERGHSAPS